MNSIGAADWSLLQTFLAVMETGSLSAAGRTLRLSQPTVGRQIAELETQLGTVLFTRSARGLVPTDLAQSLLPKVQEMQAAAASLSMAVTGASAQIAGTVRVTASELFSAFVVPELCAPLLADHPELQIELVASNSNENLLARDADIALRMVRPTQNDLVMRKAGETPMGLFAHENYVATHGSPESMAGLGDHVFIGYDKDTLLIRGMAQMGINAAPTDFRFRCDNQIVQLEALRAGLGIGIAQLTVAAQIDGLIRLLPELQIPALPVYVVAHQELASSARVRLVYDHLAEAIGLRLGMP